MTKMYCPTCNKSVPTTQMVGVEIRGVFDGVLYWVHQRCNTAIQRWHASGYRQEESRARVEQYNATRLS